MNYVNKFRNRRFSLQQLADSCGTDPKIVNEYRNLFRAQRRLTPEAYSNGRTNHIAIQEMIDGVSNGNFKYGSQGNNSSDCYVNNQETETKAYNQKSSAKELHVAASCFFASNGKKGDHYKKLLAKNLKEEAESFLFEHSYDKNEYYLLTNTGKLDLDFDDIELTFISKDTLVRCLNPDDKRKVILSEVDKKVKPLVP